MAYQTGPVSTISELIDTMVNFAAANGWTKDTISGGGNGWALHSASGGYWSFRYGQGPTVDAENGNPFGQAIAQNQGFYVYNNTGFNAALPAHRQPGWSASNYPAAGGWFDLKQAGPYTTYWLFVTEQYVHLVVEVQSKVYAHFGIGTLDKRGSSYGGGFYTQHHKLSYNPSSSEGNGLSDAATQYVWDSFRSVNNSRCQVDIRDGEIAGRELLGVYTNNAGAGDRGWSALGHGSDTYHPDDSYLDASANQMTGETVLIPNRVYMIGNQSRLRPLGEVADFAFCDMSFCSPAQVQIYGSEEWIVFPAFRVGISALTSSLQRGNAYRIRR
ncbi:structural protein [Pseudomonas phage SM1]|uniref:Virion structural protein n=2 Tax=Samunavirus TaxID=2560221 RepID=A0A0U2KZ01_9CAUD|nr:structural protein [Pseudomonas phage SM1]UGC97141.1 hypothetical protein [Pseudomonas phage BHU-1]UGV19900.1 hypothetical protein [Pseudomonas phage Pa BHU-15]UIW13660.1 hypothetical protein [Pseudomonas phage Pa BHU-17]WDS62432.1 hypothetical protein UFRH6_1 [Pseudomonas phage UF_RH6]HBO9768535.1 hypothetical protein [Pseudomonas aeruginosa]